MRHFKTVLPPAQLFSRYVRFDRPACRTAIRLAAKLAGTPIFHINSAAKGGGVAELLQNQVPLECNLGLQSHWLAIQEPKRFFKITKKIHNLLQGKKGQLTHPEKAFYLGSLKGPGLELGRMLEKKKDPGIVVLHDPQVLPLLSFLPSGARTIVRLHIDLSSANRSILQFLKPYLLQAGAVVVSNPSFRPSWMDGKKTAVSYPAISPFSPKNCKPAAARIKKLFRYFGIDPARPTAAQISRFDLWKDPRGVIEAYLLARKKIPGLQLVMEGVMEAADDPEARGIYESLVKEFGTDPDIFLHGEKKLSGKSYEQWVSALQAGAGVIIQKSIREGFGLTVTEALWKGKAVIGGNAAGINAQIQNGVNGYIVRSPAECARRLIELIRRPSLAASLGKRGKETVRKKFLFHRLILDFLRLYETGKKSSLWAAG